MGDQEGNRILLCRIAEGQRGEAKPSGKVSKERWHSGPERQQKVARSKKSWKDILGSRNNMKGREV